MNLWSGRRALATTFCCIAAAFAVASCSDDDAVAPEPPRGPELKIEADSLLVTVSWNPDFEVNKLVMMVQGDVWFIYDESALIPPVTYGEKPPGAQALNPVQPSIRLRPDLDYYPVTLIRSEEAGDQVVANGAHRGAPMVLPSVDGESVIYAQAVSRITPPGVVPEVWEFILPNYTVLTAVPNAAWKDLSDDDEVETFLKVRPAIVRQLIRDENGVHRLLEYDDLRVAEVDVDGETISFIWDQITP
jgi:hypothetical protein